MIPTDRAVWLQEQTVLQGLSVEGLNAIAEAIEERTIPAHQQLVVQGTVPCGLYILREGRLENDTTSQIGPAWTSSLLPGAIIQLQELLLEQPANKTVITLTDSQLWFIPAVQFRQLVAQYPEMSQALSRQLMQQVSQLSSQLTYEQERQTALRPYLVPKVKRGVVGTSRYAARLRQQIQKATADCRPVLIFGEPGLEKDNLAALVHFGSPQRRSPIIQINCNTLQASGADLFGRVGGKPGLIEYLGEGTLVLNNIQELPSELMPKLAQLLETGTFTPISRLGEPLGKPTAYRIRIVMIAEKSLSSIERWVPHLIKVPPLRVRKADIKDQVGYYISLSCRRRGVPIPKVTPEALRRLQEYDFPSNLRELQSLVDRALVQAAGATELTEAVFWPERTQEKRFRLNLLNTYPRLRRFLRSPWWPDRINYGFTLPFFALVVAVLFVGPQNRAENVALNLFWAWWWPLVLLGFPFVGRLWCAVCPFMIYGEVTQKLSLWLFPRQLKRWPRQQAEQWGGWFLFGLFALIYLWEELWDLQDTAYLSACLLLLITAGAMICSAIFERRFWCRYLCPIGGMNGLFAKLSMTELRAQQGTCSAECTTYQCYKGGPQKGEGQATDGCPLYSHPAQLQDNRNCVLCMTCLQACPHRSVEFNLRPPGIELWTTHIPHSYEIALLLLLLGGAFLHHLPEVEAQLSLEIPLTQFWPHLGLSLVVLLLPASLPLIAHGCIKLVQQVGHRVGLLLPKPRPFLELAYGYLPLVLGGNLAHYLHLGLGEAGRILPVAWATIGLGGEGLPTLVAHPAVIAFLQGVTLTASVLFTILLTQKIARQPFRLLLPQYVGAGILGISLWKLIIQS
ncbi:MAG: sigma 54-interacting transcriptional regulator [Leptolyngbyaceae bacterium]|nr:sigma 54-interacting transcriptional regulator [Leptolyngbyaceae bacterium]